MAQYPIDIIDVFAEKKLAGNQLAVVHDAADLSTDEMQAIALETNFSETTFVTDRSENRATVRIFTPAWELPFAGHPTLGTAWVLTGGEGEITLDLGVGPVTVTFADGQGWISVPEVQFHGDFERSQAARLIGLSEDDLGDAQVELLEVGPRFVLISVKNLATLKQAKLDGDLHAELVAQGVGVQCVFVFSEEPYEESADFATRMFFESNGVREDPATGSSRTPLD